MNKRRTLIITLAAVSLITIQTRAADSRATDEQQIKKIEQDWIRAILKRDAVYLRKIAADDYTMTGPDGKLASKEEDIKNMSSGDTVFDDFQIDNVKIRFYGDTAIVNGRGTVKAREKDQDRGGKYSWTDVFVKQNGEWKAAAAHVTPMMADKK